VFIPTAAMIACLLFYAPLKNFSLIRGRHHCRWRAAKFRPMLGAQGLWAGRDLYRATPAETRDLGFSGLIRRTAPLSCLLRHARGCGEPILTRILTGTLQQCIGVIHEFGFMLVCICTALHALECGPFHLDALYCTYDPPWPPTPLVQNFDLFQFRVT
jgi:hypothetical protein